MKRFVSVLVAGAMLVVFLVGCRQQSAEEQKPPPGASVESSGTQIQAPAPGRQQKPGEGVQAPIRRPGR